MISLQYDQNLEKALREGNLMHIKNALSGIMLRDKGFNTNEFDESLKYAQSKIGGLIEEDDGDTEFKPQSEWNAGYWDYLNAALIYNFSRKKIDHIKEVGRFVYGSAPSSEKKTSNPSRQSSTSPSSQTTARQSSRAKSQNTNQFLNLPIAAAGVVIVLIIVMIFLSSR